MTCFFLFYLFFLFFYLLVIFSLILVSVALNSYLSVKTMKLSNNGVQVRKDDSVISYD